MSSFLTNRTAKNSISKNLTVSDTNTNNIICNTLKIKQLPNNAFVKTDNSSQLKTDKIYISDIDDINILQTDINTLSTRITYLEQQNINLKQIIYELLNMTY